MFLAAVAARTRRIRPITYIGALIAGVVVIALQLYYVTTNWKEVGTPYVVLVLAWLAGELITSFAA